MSGSSAAPHELKSRRSKRRLWNNAEGFAPKVTKALFSVQPLCSLCLCGVFLLRIHQPQRHREHRGCTEKSAVRTFKAKLLDTVQKSLSFSKSHHDVKAVAATDNYSPKSDFLNLRMPFEAICHRQRRIHCYHRAARQ